MAAISSLRNPPQKEIRCEPLSLHTVYLNKIKADYNIPDMTPEEIQTWTQSSNGLKEITTTASKVFESIISQKIELTNGDGKYVRMK